MPASPATAIPTPVPTLREDIRFETLTIGPDLARDWLNRSHSGRKLDPRRVEAYKRDMQLHRWKVNGESVVLSDKGTLLDGRHRLYACIEAGTRFRTLVVSGIPEAAFETIDALRRRTLADIMVIRKSNRALAPALTIIWRYYNADLGEGRKRPSSQELLHLLDVYPELRDESDPDGSIRVAYDVRRVIPQGTGIAFHFLFSRVDPDRANAFFQQIIDAETNDEPTPGRILRAALASMTEEGGRRHRPTLMAFLIKAWNAFYAGQDLPFLRYVPERERFPMIAGLDVDAEGIVRGDAALGNKDLLSYDAAEDGRDLRAEYVLVTPDMAEQLLRPENNPTNRSIAQAIVNRYARDMRAGNWQLNGQTVKVSASGRLLDGQHRLKACIEARTGFPAIVVHNVQADAFDTFDLGTRKSYHVVLAERGEHHTTTLAAALKWLWLHERNRLQVKGDAPTAAELDDVLSRHPDIRKSLTYVNKLRALMAPALGITLHYLCARKNRQLADEFFNRLADGLGLGETDPVYLLREKFIRQRTPRRVIAGEVERWVWVAKAWNAYRCGDDVRQLSWRNRGPAKEPIPAIQ